ncbi:hypothetical protein GCM10009775_10000 [Microbacterium aoyamense]|uniref:Glycosyltransferase 2-like domain-containing protein n=1 Tax=Microbacterium aoyamense TaxID=344166 RepID=A0ABN2PE43_9MICO|nr:glycosyltransferase family A protein [Microbacterium aoyamense]
MENHAQPLVSVVVATNRVGPYLREALESVAAQTWPRIEVVVVDDGSPEPDAVESAARVVAGARVLHIPASGVAVARNIGVAATTGEYLVFLDDDDRWRPERIERHLAAMADAPDVVVTYCGMQTIDSAGEKVLVPADQVQVASRLDVARRRTGIILPNVVMRRDAFFTVGGFHSRLRLAQDFDLILRLAEYGDFLFVPETLVDYRASTQNVTRRYRELTAFIRQILTVHELSASARGDAELSAALQESLRKNDRFAWWSAGRAAKASLGERKPAAAFGAMWWALRTAPSGLFDGLRRRITGDR